MKKTILPLALCLLVGMSLPATAGNNDTSPQKLTPAKIPSPPIEKDQYREISSKNHALPNPLQGVSAKQSSRQSTRRTTPQDYDQRLALAEQVHEYLPIRLVVEDTLEILTPGLSAEDSAQFKQDIIANMDLDELEQLSIETMATIFTQDEIRAMIDYYSKPEAKSINRKLPSYREVLDPAIINAISTAAGEMTAEETPEVPQQSEAPPRRGERL